jgi:hypothetical protein
VRVNSAIWPQEVVSAEGETDFMRAVRLFAGFADPRAPVVCFAGPETRSVVRVPRRLFALLRVARAPSR